MDNKQVIVVALIATLFGGLIGVYMVGPLIIEPEVETQYVNVTVVEYVKVTEYVDRPVWNVSVWNPMKEIDFEKLNITEPVMVFCVASDWADEMYEAFAQSVEVSRLYRYSEEQCGWHDPEVSEIVIIDTLEHAQLILDYFENLNITWIVVH